jgi:hypothetical protein
MKSTPPSSLPPSYSADLQNHSLLTFFAPSTEVENCFFFFIQFFDGKTAKSCVSLVLGLQRCEFLIINRGRKLYFGIFFSFLTAAINLGLISRALLVFGEFPTVRIDFFIAMEFFSPRGDKSFRCGCSIIFVTVYGEFQAAHNHRATNSIY